jgi:hypothetical protein
MEIDELLNRVVSKGYRLIPVLLKNAPDSTEVPAFVRGSSWVDFRQSEPDPLRQLIRGITDVAD